MRFYTNEAHTHTHEDLQKWLQNEKIEGSTHKIGGTWMKVDSILVRVNEHGNDVTGVEEAELLVSKFYIFFFFFL